MTGVVLLNRPRAQDPVARPAAPAGPATARSPAVLRRLSAADGLLFCSMALWAISIPRIDPRAMTEWGLFSALPMTFFFAVGILAVSIAVVLRGRAGNLEKVSTARLALHLVALVVVLHGTIPAAFSLPNYPWAYKHIGVASYANLHGGFDPSIDVYNNWPGFFALAAFFTKIAGAGSPLEYARWCPVYFNLLISLELAFAFRALPIRRRERWLALFLFVGANWVGQDYFAPQALAYVLSLAVIGIALNWLSATRALDLVWAERFVGRVLRTFWPNADRADDAVSQTPWPCALGAIFAVFCVVVVSHVLSPLMIVFGLGLIAAAGRIRPRWVVAVLAAMAGAFIAAHYFALPHNGLMDAQDLLEVFGHPFGSNPTGAKAEFGRRVTALGAPAVIALMWGMGGVGAVRRIRAGRPTLVIGLLAVSPLLTLSLSGYGGEALLRIYLFSLPWVAVFAACALEPSRRRRPRLAGPALAVVALFSMSAFYGSAELYYIRPAELRAAQYFYDHAEPGSVLVTAVQQFPEKVSGSYGTRFIPSLQLLTTLDERGKPFGFHRRMLGTRDVRKVEEFIDQFATTRRGPAYLVLSTGQEMYARVLGLSPPGALRSLGRALAGSRRWSVFYRNTDATIYRFAIPARASGAPVHLPSVNRRWIDWMELAIGAAGLGVAAIGRRRKMTNETGNGRRTTVTDGGILLEPLRTPPELWEVIERPPEIAPEPIPERTARSETSDLIAVGLTTPADREASRLALSRLEPEWGRLGELLAGVDTQLRPEAIRLLTDAWGSAPLPRLQSQLSDQWPAVRTAAVAALAVDASDVPQLQQLLADDFSADVRVETLHALATAPDGDQMTALACALSDPDPLVRETAVEVLPVAGSAAAADAVLAAADDTDERVRMAAIKRLASGDHWVLWLAVRRTTRLAEFCTICESVAPGRLAAMARVRLGSPEADDRRAAIAALTGARTSEVESLLAAAVAADKDAEVRRAAVAGLSGRTTAVGTVASALGDPDEGVRLAAVTTLATIEHDGATDALIAALADPNAEVRHGATMALAGRVSPGLARRMGAMLTPANAASVGRVLAMMGAVGEEILIAAVGDGPPGRAAAAAELLRGRADVVARIQDIGSVDPSRRLRAIDTVGLIGGPSAFAPLIAALSDPWPGVRARAVHHLVRLKDERGLEAVREALGVEQDAGVRDEANELLVKRG